MGISLQGKDVLLINPPHYDADYKTEIQERFFEGIGVKSLNIMDSASLSLFSTGATRGFVIESGHTLTTTIPIYEVIFI
jgi:actin-related protein